MRDLRGAGARVRQSTPIQQRGIVRTGRGRFAKGVARVPRRAAVEMRADGIDRAQNACASAIHARVRCTLTSRRICGGNASISAAACFNSSARCGEPASADA